MYLWAAVPGGETSEAYAERLLAEHGLLVSPGSYFGPSGEGYVRLSLVPSLEECRHAASVLLACEHCCKVMRGATTLDERARAGERAVEEIVAALDRGELRVAEKVTANGWSTAG